MVPDSFRGGERMKKPKKKPTANYFEVMEELGKKRGIKVTDMSKRGIRAIGFMLAADSYREILSAMIEEFKIQKANTMIQGKLTAAKMLPFTDSPEQAQKLLDELT
jgi:hypothetical protein